MAGLLRSALRCAPLALAAVTLASGCSTAPSWELVWSDEFSLDGLPDSSKWGYATGGHGWGNDELQYYRRAHPDNARVRDGTLIITARQRPHGGNDYTSARLISRGKGDWQYGRFEIRARLPEGRGTWPAIWMMPSDWEFEMGGWPDVGEIDIMEHVGHDPGLVHASAHSAAHQWQNGTQRTGSVRVEDAAHAFHTYGLEWTAEHIRASVDGRFYFTYTNDGEGPRSWPFDKPFYLIMNIAVGGAWGGMAGVDTTSFPQSMEVDYVRVYRRLP